jgi:hypothetical protein
MTIKLNKYEGMSKLPLSLGADLFLRDPIHEL